MLHRLNEKISDLFNDRNLLDGKGVPGIDEPLIDLFPYRAFEEESGLFVNVNSCGFMLEVSPLPGAGEETIKQLTTAFSDNMPDKSSVQVMLWASPRVDDVLERWYKERENSPEVYRDIAERRVAFFADAGWQSPIADEGQLLRDYRTFVVGSLPGPLERRRDVLTSMRSNMKAALETIGILVETLHPAAFLSIMDEWLRPGEESFRSQHTWRSLDPLNHQLGHSDSSIEVYPDRLRFADRYDVRCLSVQQYPDYWAGWQNGQLLGSPYSDYQRVPCPYMLSFNFTVGSEVADATRAGLKSTRAVQKAGSDLARFMPMIQEQASEWRYVADRIREGHKLALCSYQVIAFARADEGDKAEQALRSIFRVNGWRLTKDRYMQLQSFLAAMPFMPAEGMVGELEKLGRAKTLLTWSCANLAPLVAETKGMLSALILLIGRRGQPFYWNPFANTEGNYNVAVIGKSGSGKSVLMQELVTSIAGAGGQVIVVDDGYSFMNSCLLQDGEFVSFSGTAEICLNPFSIVDAAAFERDPEYREGALSMMCGLVQQMCRSKSQTDDFENAHIEQAVSQVWREWGVEGEIDHVGKILEANDDNRVCDLGHMLRPCMRGGMYERYWNGKCTLQVGKHLTVFELSEIKSRKDLQGLVMMMLMFVATEAMYHGKRSRPKALFIDEAWDLLHGSASKLFIEGLARRARKYNGALITGTQSANDYYKNEAAVAAFENTDWICFLSQKDESIEHMKNSGRIVIDEVMDRDLKSLKVVEKQFSEVMIYGPRGYSVGRLMFDPFSMQVFSSKAEDVETIKQFQAKGYSLTEAVEKSAALNTKIRETGN